MEDDYLVQLLLEKYACACSLDCTRSLHEWVQELRRELMKRLALSAGERMAETLHIIAKADPLENARYAAHRAAGALGDPNSG